MYMHYNFRKRQDEYDLEALLQKHKQRRWKITYKFESNVGESLRRAYKTRLRKMLSFKTVVS